jgi:hypothetical protein
MRRTTPLLSFVLVLAACGGGGRGGTGGGAKGASSSGASGGDGDSDALGRVSIGDRASQQGGLSMLGGAGNREAAPPAPVADTFRADLVEKSAPVKIDGVLGEWPPRIGATTKIKGSAEGTTFASALQYDDAKLYIAGEVTDATFNRTSKIADDEDHASLLLAFPSGGGFVTYEVGLFAGIPGETAGEVRWLTGGHGAVPGAKIVEATAPGGYTFEASIPWGAFPEARTVRVGLRGAARYYDQSGSAARVVLATGPGDAQSPGQLPWLPTEPEQSVIDGLLIPKQLSQTPRAELFADVAGDAMKERVAVYDRYFTISGPGFRGGREFFFRDLGAELVKLEARDLTGRAKEDLLVRRRFKTPGGTREWFEVWSILKGEEPTTTFAHEIEIANGAKHVANAVHVSSAREIEVTLEPAQGWDAASWHEPTSTEVEPLLLPWGTVKAQTFKFDSGKFKKVNVVAQAGVPGPTPTPTPTARPRSPS